MDRPKLQSLAVFLVMVIVVGTVTPAVSLAKTTSGGTATVPDTDQCLSQVVINDATINDSTNSTVEIAYSLPDSVAPENASLSVQSPGLWNPNEYLNTTVSSQSGVIELTIPNETYQGGVQRFTASLKSGYETLNADTAEITVESDTVVTNYTVNTTEPYPNEPVNVTVTAENRGSTAENITLSLVEYRSYRETYTPVTSKTVEVTGDSKKNVTFTVSSYVNSVAVNGNKTTAIDVQSALRVSNVSWSDQSPAVGDNVSVSANVTNISPNNVTNTVSLRDGIEEKYKRAQVDLNASESTEVTFSYTVNRSTNHSVRIGGTETYVNVSNPVDVTNVTFNESTVYQFETVNATATVTNTGGSNGTYPVTFRNSYDHIRTKEVTLGPNETKVVNVTHSFSSTGEEQLQVNNRTVTQTVESAYTVENVTVSDAEVTIGEEVTIQTTVNNTHSDRTRHSEYLSAYPSPDGERTSFCAAPGESETITTTVSFTEGGTGRIYGFGQTLAEVTVVNPVNATSFSLESDSVQVNENVTVTASVVNTGSTAGTYPVRLTNEYGYETFGRDSVTLDSGESTNVTFNASFDSAKSYTPRVNNKTGDSITVTNPVKVVNYSLSKRSLYTGESTTVTANVTHTGNTTGTYPVAFKHWGDVEGQTTVDIAPNKTQKVRFDVTFRNDIEQNDRVAIGNQTVDDFLVEERIAVQSVNISDGVATNETIHLNATFHNPTNEPGELRYDSNIGSDYSSDRISLDPGETTTVNLSGSFSSTGRHWHNLGSKHVYLYTLNDTSGTANLTIPDQPFPTTAIKGERTFIPVKVVNQGDAGGVTDVEFAVNGKNVATKRAYAEPGKEGYVWIEQTFNSTGTHTVTIDGERTLNISVIDPVITNSSVTHVNGTAPSTMPRVDARYTPYGGVFVSLRSSDGHPDLSQLGADTTSEFQVNITVSDYSPRVLLNTGKNTTWTTTNLSGNETRVSITISPSELNFREDPPRLENWNDQNDTADYQIDAGAWMLIGDGKNARYDQPAVALDGLTVSTDAQRFRQPQYYPGGNDSTPRVEVKIGGPHFAKDGTVNKGHYTAFIPDSMLDAWNVSDASELTVNYSADDGTTSYTITKVDGGLRVAVDLHYSAGTISIAKDSSSGSQTTETATPTPTATATQTETATETQTPTQTETTGQTTTPATATTEQATTTPATATTEQATTTPATATTEDETATRSSTTTVAVTENKSDQTSTTTEESGDGFGVLVTLVAVFASIVFARRRDH